MNIELQVQQFLKIYYFNAGNMIRAQVLIQHVKYCNG